MIKVIFRKDKKDGTVIAFFPEFEANRGRIACYEHIGQHGEADLMYYWQNTKKATPEEYEPLYRELTDCVGYVGLIVMQRLRR